MTISGFMTYKYMVRLHLHGRITDVYNRIQSPESCFFTPYDCEVSKRELDNIIFLSKTWRSDSGEVKRVVAEEIEDFEICCF
eukprot:gene36742-49807_t